MIDYFQYDSEKTVYIKCMDIPYAYSKRKQKIKL